MDIITKYIRQTETLRFGFFIYIFIVLIGCANKELSADEIVSKSIEAHGGLGAWKTIQQISFDKETKLFREDGSVESHTEQFQLFQQKSSLFGKIEWENNNDDILIVYEKDKVYKYVNDSVVVDAGELKKARNSFFAAQYVINQPFALLDDNVSLELKGTEVVNERQAYAVAVKYDGDTKNSNQWTYYIDTETFEVVANKVVLTDHTSWVENLTFDTSTDFKMNAHRKSYRLNAAGEKTYLRAEYWYRNYDIIH